MGALNQKGNSNNCYSCHVNGVRHARIPEQPGSSPACASAWGGGVDV